MSTKVNVKFLSTLENKTEVNKALVIVQHLIKADNITATILELNSLGDLEENFPIAENKVGDNKANQLFELAQIEYLLESDVGVVVLDVKGSSTIKADVEALLKSNIDKYNIRVITFPTGDDATVLGEIASLLKLESMDDIELHINVDGLEEVTIANGIDAKVGNNRNVSIFTGKGVLGVPSLYQDGNNDVIILASVMAQSRKVYNTENGRAHVPIAGETTGVFNDFNNVVTNLSRKEKEDYQTNGINPLISKTGVGVHFVAQNTRNGGATTAPLNRAHANTLTNYLIGVFRNLGDKYHFRPNISKTWDLFELDAKRVLRTLLKEDGIEGYAVITGRKLMSDTDVAEGKFKAEIHFLPTRVIESVTLNLVVHDDLGVIVELAEQGEE